MDGEEASVFYRMWGTEASPPPPPPPPPPPRTEPLPAIPRHPTTQPLAPKRYRWPAAGLAVRLTHRHTPRSHARDPPSSPHAGTFVLKFINTGLLYLIINFYVVKQIVGDTGIDEEWSVSW